MWVLLLAAVFKFVKDMESSGSLNLSPVNLQSRASNTDFVYNQRHVQQFLTKWGCAD